MNKEELERIRENIEMQIIAEQSMGYKNQYSTSLQREISMYNEIVDSHEKIDKVIELLETTELVNNEGGTILLKDCDYMDEVISILRG